jgi:hypothetical protein
MTHRIVVCGPICCGKSLVASIIRDALHSSIAVHQKQDMSCPGALFAYFVSRLVTFAKACESGTSFVTTSDVFTDHHIVIPSLASELDTEELRLLDDIFRKLDIPMATHRILTTDDASSIFMRAFSRKDACHLTMRAIRENVCAWHSQSGADCDPMIKYDATLALPTFIEFNPNEFHILKTAVVDNLTRIGFSAVYYVARKSAIDAYP